jgi:hypothetical protein
VNVSDQQTVNFPMEQKKGRAYKIFHTEACDHTHPLVKIGMFYDDLEQQLYVF